MKDKHRFFSDGEKEVWDFSGGAIKIPCPLAPASLVTPLTQSVMGLTRTGLYPQWLAIVLYSMPQYIVSLQFILYGRRPNLLNDSWPLQSPPYAPHYLPYSIYTSLHLLSPILTYNTFHNNNDCLYHSPNNRDFSCT